MFQKKDDTKKKLALGAVAGALAGYVTGILTAPKSGKETRADIADKAGDIKDDAAAELKKADEELKELLQAAKDKTITLSSQARSEFNEAVATAKDAQNKASTILKAVRAGGADDPQLDKALKQARQAKKNLSKFLKK